jgi:8-oxo-dGTP pyrophosphatase MutT (NUDIX family)
MERKVLHETKWLTLLELKDPENGVDGYICTHSGWTNGQGIAVLPYRYHMAGGEIEYLLRQEVTPCWSMEPSLSSITGGMDKDGEPPWECAVRELKEEGGYLCEYPGRWNDLGSVMSNKSSTTLVHLFAVDLTGLEFTGAEGDGTVLEAKAWCEWRTDPEAAVDPLVGSLVLKFEKLVGR